MLARESHHLLLNVFTCIIQQVLILDNTQSLRAEVVEDWRGFRPGPVGVFPAPGPPSEIDNFPRFVYFDDLAPRSIQTNLERQRS